MNHQVIQFTSYCATTRTVAIWELTIAQDCSTILRRVNPPKQVTSSQLQQIEAIQSTNASNI
jgi:hypothetical protein